MKQFNTSITLSARINNGLVKLAKGVMAVIRGENQGNGSSSST